MSRLYLNYGKKQPIVNPDAELPAEKRKAQLDKWRIYDKHMNLLEQQAEEERKAAKKALENKEKEDNNIENNTNIATPTPQPFKKRSVKFDNDAVFLAACSSDDIDDVSILLKNGQDVNTKNADGLTALHTACINGKYKMCELLVDKGANINIEDNEGWTPLHAAAASGHLRIANFLVGRHANVEAVNCDGNLALDVTEDKACQVLLEGALTRKGILSESDRAKARRIEENMITEKVIQLKADIEAGKRSGVGDLEPHETTKATILHVAASKGYIRALNILLDEIDNVNINVEDSDGWTPLHACCHWENLEVIKILVERKANILAKNRFGQMPVDVISSESQLYNYVCSLTMQAKNKEQELEQQKALQNESVETEESESGEVEIPIKPIIKSREDLEVECSESNEDVNDFSIKNKDNITNESEVIDKKEVNKSIIKRVSSDEKDGYTFKLTINDQKPEPNKSTSLTSKQSPNLQDANNTFSNNTSKFSNIGLQNPKSYGSLENDKNEIKKDARDSSYTTSTNNSSKFDKNTKPKSLLNSTSSSISETLTMSTKRPEKVNIKRQKPKDGRSEPLHGFLTRNAREQTTDLASVRKGNNDNKPVSVSTLTKKFAEPISRNSGILTPDKNGCDEVTRKVRSKHSLSSRRSTQGVTLDDVTKATNFGTEPEPQDEVKTPSSYIPPEQRELKNLLIPTNYSSKSDKESTFNDFDSQIDSDNSHFSTKKPTEEDEQNFQNYRHRRRKKIVNRPKTKPLAEQNYGFPPTIVAPTQSFEPINYSTDRRRVSKLNSLDSNDSDKYKTMYEKELKEKEKLKYELDSLKTKLHQTLQNLSNHNSPNGSHCSSPSPVPFSRNLQTTCTTNLDYVKSNNPPLSPSDVCSETINVINSEIMNRAEEMSRLRMEKGSLIRVISKMRGHGN